MIHIRKTTLIVAFVYAAFFSSYGKVNEVEEIKNIVKVYNRIVIEESKNERHRDIRTFVKMMEEIATHDIARKLYIWIQSWHENGLFMNAKLNSIKFRAVNIKDKIAEVVTEENWTYGYFDRRINKQVLPQTRIYYKVRYRLKKLKDRWLITDIRVLQEKNEAGGKK
ncbi:hypothetical protein GWK41_06775 [Persephonella atlantica]|uniref:Uncharacterized protein n=1 Tax=Persephonella atlantica TaxID=2699429 RepID=A0ABS1GIM2_9AQUI|nr:hypothetical protein [Persephonella atlantica]MBK3332769.1 hypothetical protein [Persephonella atlantica]